jgi:undecaprenyl-diphosphatase
MERAARGAPSRYHRAVPAGTRRIDPWLLVAIVCATGFLLLAFVLNGQGEFAFDAPVAAFVRGLPVPTDVWLALTGAGGAILVPIGIGLVLVLLGLRQYRVAVTIAVALIGATLATDLVKDLVSRPRPPGVPLAPTTGYSFPSGHSLLSAVTYGLVALAVWRSGLPLGLRRVVVVGLVLLVILIGLSRIALGAHYPSDVLAGWLAGVAVVATVAAVTRSDAPLPSRPTEGRPQTDPPDPGPRSG